MLAAYTFLGEAPGNYKYFFYLLLDPYLANGQQLGVELLKLLEAFAEDLRSAGVVVHPHHADLDSTNREMHQKPWTESQRKAVDDNLPGLLMLDKPFGQFDPRDDRWIHFNFGTELKKRGLAGLYGYSDVLRQIAAAAKDPTQDVFAKASAQRQKLIAAEAAEIFELKPGIFGLSIDLRKGTDVVSDILGGRLGTDRSMPSRSLRWLRLLPQWLRR